MAISLDTLQKAISDSWSAETTANPDEWDRETTPERGQCVPTALVVQDYLGGEIERLSTSYGDARETHYRNIIDGGKVIDLSRAQYPSDQEFTPAPIEKGVRDYVLENENTRLRYQILAQTVKKLIELTEE